MSRPTEPDERPRPLGPLSLPAWPRPFDPDIELDWGDPVMSRRLLAEHLDQAHDGASRRVAEVDRHVARLGRLLPAGPLRILDAACGPGLYTVRLARLGHTVTGTDVGPAVLAHARSEARAEHLEARARFVRWDLREEPPSAVGGDHDAALLLYWVLEAFPRAQQPRVLTRLGRLLRPGGRLVAELRVTPGQPPGRLSAWEHVPRSLLGDGRHLLLTDTTWDERRRLYVLREVAVHADGSMSAQQTTGALTTLDEVRAMVARAGLVVRSVYDGWGRATADTSSASLLVVAERPR